MTSGSKATLQFVESERVGLLNHRLEGTGKNLSLLPRRHTKVRLHEQGLIELISLNVQEVCSVKLDGEVIT